MLYCIVALLADHRGSIVPFWQIVAGSRSLSSLPRVAGGWIHTRISLVVYTSFPASHVALTGC